MIVRVRARRLAATALTLLATLLAAPAVAAEAPAVAAEAPAATTGTVALQLASLTPSQLTASSVLTLTVRVANSTDRPLSGAVATLGINRRVSLSRAVLANWATAKDGANTGQQVAKAPVPTVAAGSSTTITLKATPAALGLSSSTDWGPRGIAVVLTRGDTRLDVLRTFAVWASTTDTTAVRVSVLAAVTGPAVTGDKTTDDDELASATAADGRLGKLLAATADVPGVGWAVDPALVETASASANADVHSWARRLLAAAQGRSVIALPAYDPDPAAYAHAGRPWPTSTKISVESSNEPKATPTAGTTEGTATSSTKTGTAQLTIPSSWRTDVAWPATDKPDLTTTALTTASGRKYVVVGGGAMAPDEDLTYTPTALSAVPKQSGTVALVADQILTDQIETAEAKTAPDSSAADSTAVRTQRLLAETAVIAREHPNDQRDMLIALTRSWTPNVEAAKAQFAALSGVNWVRMTSIDEVLSATPDRGHRASLPASATNSSEISPHGLTTLAEDSARLSRFAAIANNPAELTDSLQSAFVTPASVAFRSEPSARNTAVANAGAQVSRVTSAVSVVKPDTFNLLSEKSDLPITVRNGLDQPVTVTVTLVSNDTRLELESSPTMTVPAHGQVEAKIPAHAIGTGDVRVTGTLSGPSGPISEPFTFKVRVRAKWETVGTAVMGTLLGVLFLGGIWRTIRRRGRSERRLAGALADQPALPDAERDRPPSGPAGRTEE